MRLITRVYGNGPPIDQSDCCICYNYILNVLILKINDSLSLSYGMDSFAVETGSIYKRHIIFHSTEILIKLNFSLTWPHSHSSQAKI